MMILFGDKRLKADLAAAREIIKHYACPKDSDEDGCCFDCIRSQCGKKAREYLERVQA